MHNFEGQTVIVTGAASGLGAAIARAFLEAGACVMLADLVEGGVGEMLERFPDRAWFQRLDVASEASWLALSGELHRHSPRLDVLVNCAGIMNVADIETTTHEMFMRTLSVNAGGAFLGCQNAIREMRAGGRPGAIVNIASTTAIKPASWVMAYAASKAAVVSLTRSIALHCALSRYPIRCNAVLPGAVLTPMVRNMIDASPDPKAALAGLEAQHPVGRLVTVEEVAATVLHLSSPAASGVIGAAWVVDGGMTAG